MDYKIMRTRCAEKIAYDKALARYNANSRIYRFFHKAPTTTEEFTAKNLADEWTAIATMNLCYNKGHIQEFMNGDYVKVHISYQKNNPLLPVVMFRAYYHGTYMVSRMALNDDGTWEEWGCPAPFDECGFTLYPHEAEQYLQVYEVFLTAYANFQLIIKNWK